MDEERSFVPGVSRWRADGTRLTASFGTWRGKEYELRGVKQDQEETLALVSRSNEAPGPMWKTVRRHPNNFAAPPVEHVLRVPAAEVSGIVRVTVTGDLGRNRKVEILAEDAEGRLAVIQANHWQESDQRRAIAYWDFSPFYASEPLSHQSVFGWIPADRVSGIQCETEHFQPRMHDSTAKSAGLQQGSDLP